MKVTTFEGVVENGRIRLSADVDLPEKATVHVVVTELGVPQGIYLGSPRLAHREQAADFAKIVVEEAGDAGV